MAAPIIRLEGLAKRFGDAAVVEEVSLDIAEGEFFALLGPSGCGKTTLLRMLAGLETPSAGRITIDGVDMTGMAANRRPVNMVFQSYAVFPHMSVAQNVGYGLKVERIAPAERTRRVEAALAQVRLEGFGPRRPDQLSGGQRQRVALARALVKRPRVLLLDEPLSALDAKLREEMRGELTRLQREVGITFVMVTHDQGEALATADRCAVMERGRLRQVAAPADLYERPDSRFVADFIGAINLFEGRIVAGPQGDPRLEAQGLGEVPLQPPVALAQGAQAWLAVRPEKIALTREAPPPAGDAVRLRGRIVGASYRGGATMFEAALADGLTVRALNRETASQPLATGEAVWIVWPIAAQRLLSA